MAYQRRAPANPNTIKLTFDFDTLDRLKAEASRRSVDTTRCAYELIQEALRLRPAAPLAVDPAPEPDSHLTFDWRATLKPSGGV